MDLCKRNIVKNDIVFGKVRGFCPWPCVIEAIEGNIATVTFFSRNRERNQMSLQNITPIKGALYIMKNHFNRHVEFTKFVKEVQITISSAKSRNSRATKIKTDMNYLMDAYNEWAIQKNRDIHIVTQSTPISNERAKSNKLETKANLKKTGYNLRSKNQKHRYNLRKA